MDYNEVGRVRFKSFGWSEVNHDHRWEDMMKSGNRDKAEGALHEMKGKVKEVAGKVTDNPKLEAEGTAEKVAGKVQGKVGEVKKVLGE
jgi:uncharacterized protein YjbJ (UPF0337 family)